MVRRILDPPEALYCAVVTMVPNSTQMIGYSYAPGQPLAYSPPGHAAMLSESGVGELRCNSFLQIQGHTKHQVDCQNHEPG